MKSALAACAVLLAGLATSAHAQLTIPDTYPVTTISLSGSSSGSGTMTFDEGTFTLDGTSGEQTGFYVEGTSTTGATTYNVMYSGSSGSTQYLFSTAISIETGALPIKVIYGLGGLADDLYFFYGYSFELDLSDLTGGLF